MAHESKILITHLTISKLKGMAASMLLSAEDYIDSGDAVNLAEAVMLIGGSGLDIVISPDCLKVGDRLTDGAEVVSDPSVSVVVKTAEGDFEMRSWDHSDRILNPKL